MTEAVMEKERQTVIVTTAGDLQRIVAEAVRACLNDLATALEEGVGRPGAKRKKLISPKEIEEEFGINRRMLQCWRQDGIGPAFTNFGRKVFYDRVIFEKFVASGKIQTTGLVD